MGLTPKYVLRLFILMQNAFWASIFSRRDKIKYGKSILNHPVPDNPLIIIGHWRTGSTYLHQLLNLDPNLAAPTLLNTSLPEAYMSGAKFYVPIIKKLLGKHRPFDQIKTGVFEPQEDEFALIRMSCFSPFVNLLFPESEKYFLLQKSCSFLPDDANMQQWEHYLKEFYRKVSWSTGKRLILKNPFHSMRISYLYKTFPNARFIHIYRNPIAVVPSSVRMWSIVGTQNTMNNKWKNPGILEVSQFMNIMLNNIHEELSKLPPHVYVETKFENLENEPVKEIQRIYNSLDIPFCDKFGELLNNFLLENKNYEKNTYSLSDTEKEVICNILNTHMKKQNYL